MRYNLKTPSPPAPAHPHQDPSPATLRRRRPASRKDEVPSSAKALFTDKVDKGKVVLEEAHETDRERAYGVEYLNKKVARMVKAARTSAGEGEKIVLWKEIVEKERTDVYKFSNKIALFTLFGVALFHLFCSAGHLSWFDIGVCALYRFFIMDLYSGILHIVLDSEVFLSWKIPGFWKGALEFQWHHEIPQDLASKPFVEVVGDLIGPMLGFLLATHIYGPAGLITHHHAFGLGVNFLLALWLQLGHRMSHTRPADRPAWVKVAQRLQILLPPSDHQKHHQTYDRNFCICHGHCNGILNWVTQNLIKLDQTTVWFLMWIFMTVGEPFLSSRIIVGALGHDVADVTCHYAEMGACLTKHFQ